MSKSVKTNSLIWYWSTIPYSIGQRAKHSPYENTHRLDKTITSLF